MKIIVEKKTSMKIIDKIENITKTERMSNAHAPHQAAKVRRQGREEGGREGEHATGRAAWGTLGGGSYS